MMKKLMKLVLTVLAVCLLLSCCGGSGEEKPVTPANNGSQTAAPVTEATKAPEIQIEEALIYEGAGVTVTVKGMEEGWLGTDIKLLVENSSDRNIVLTGNNFVVNGVTLSGYLYIDAAAGKKANGTLTLYSDSLDVAGISQIGYVTTCDAQIYDSDSYETLTEVSMEIVTSLGRDYVQELDDSGEVLFESNGVQVIAKVMADEFYGKSLLLLVKNNSGRTVNVQAENVSVNGFTVDAWMYDLVWADTLRFCDLDLWNSGLEENGITEIQDISFTISIIDPNSFNTIAKSGELKVLVG